MINEDIKNIVEKLSNGMQIAADRDDLIERLVLLSGMSSSDVLALFQSDYSEEYIAGRLTLYEEVHIGDLSRDELISLLEQIKACKDLEYVIDDKVNKLCTAVADPKILDYIYWPDEELTNDEIIDKALAYKPFIL